MHIPVYGKVIVLIKAVSFINDCETFGLFSHLLSSILRRPWYVMCEDMFPHDLQILCTYHVSTLRYPILSHPIPGPLSAGLPFPLLVLLLLFLICTLILLLTFLTSILLLTRLSPSQLLLLPHHVNVPRVYSTSPFPYPLCSPSWGPTCAPVLAPTMASSPSPSWDTSQDPTADPCPYPSQSPLLSPTLDPPCAPACAPSWSPIQYPYISPAWYPFWFPNQAPCSAPPLIPSKCTRLLGIFPYVIRPGFSTPVADVFTGCVHVCTISAHVSSASLHHPSSGGPPGFLWSPGHPSDQRSGLLISVFRTQFLL